MTNSELSVDLGHNIKGWRSSAPVVITLPGLNKSNTDPESDSSFKINFHVNTHFKLVILSIDVTVLLTQCQSETK